jgi:glycosyltransferase involved in cell wall biosynthesis
MSGAARILVVVPSLARGGAERTVSRLTREWERQGHVVTVALFNAASPVYPHGGDRIDLGAPAARGTAWSRMFTAPRAFILRVLRLRRLLREGDYDHVIGFMESANIPLALASLAAGRRAAVTLSVRGNPDRMQWFHKAAVFCLYGLAARVVAVSRGVAQRVDALAPGVSARLVVIHSPVDAGDPDEASPGMVPPPARRFFAAGRLVPGKAFDRMIRVFASADCPGSVLRIAGEGPERGRLEGLIRERGLADRVTLLGALENPLEEMRRATAFLMTSAHEGFPVVLIEAMACGCPVVAFDCDFGPREAFRDGIEGFLVPPGDDARFARRLEALFGNSDLRDAMARAALRRAGDFDPGRLAARWLSGTTESA